jgi:hypothetical protein
VHSPHPQRLVHRTATASKSSNRLRLAADRVNHPRAGSPKTRGQALKRPGPVTLSFLGTAGSFHKEACGIERRPPERRGPARHPEWKAGTDHRPVVADHGDGNTGRIPFRTAVEGVPREARKREPACLRHPTPRSSVAAAFFNQAASAWGSRRAGRAVTDSRIPAASSRLA